MESWQSDAATYRSRQRYKEGIFQKGYDQGVAEMISRSIKEAFTSNDPDMVSMRSQMLRQAGVAVPQVPQGQTQGQPLPMIEDRPRHPVDDIWQPMHVHLNIPFGRAKKLTVGEGYMHPKEDIKDFNQDQIPANYAVVILTWYATEYEEFEMEYPTCRRGNVPWSCHGFRSPVEQGRHRDHSLDTDFYADGDTSITTIRCRILSPR